MFKSIVLVGILSAIASSAFAQESTSGASAVGSTEVAGANSFGIAAANCASANQSSGREHVSGALVDNSAGPQWLGAERGDNLNSGGWFTRSPCRPATAQHGATSKGTEAGSAD